MYLHKKELGLHYFQNNKQCGQECDQVFQLFQIDTNNIYLIAIFEFFIIAAILLIGPKTSTG